MNAPSDYRTRLCGSLSEIGRGAWSELLAGEGCEQPFLSWDFLDALERSGCVGADSGWEPCHLTLWRGERLAAAAPLYLKAHSYGEYVFDWAWADAYHRHGLRYYPKLLSAIPFTPVAGPRLLAADAPARAALADALLAHARGSGLSSLHVLFPREDEAAMLESRGAMLRRGVQFRWSNAGFGSFDDFLASLAQPKRKKIRAERRRVAEAGVRLRRVPGSELAERDWAFFERCYAQTYAEHRSTPYLNLGFFLRLGESLPGNVVMVIAERERRPIAASLLLRDRERLYGRHWGALEHVPCLHFEACYYQAIEEAIESGAQAIEGGAQGEHKIARGFLPVQTVSAHWLAEPAFAGAVERFLRREGAMMDGYLDELAERSPFRTGA